MVAGRRRLFLAFSFLGLCLVFTSGSVRAQTQKNSSPQSPEPHAIWGKPLSLTDLKSALERLHPGGDNAQINQLLEQLKNKNIDLNDPNFQKFLDKETMSQLNQLKEMMKQKQGEPGAAPKFSQEELDELVKKWQEFKGPDGFNGAGLSPGKIQPPIMPKKNENDVPSVPLPGDNKTIPVGQHEAAAKQLKQGSQLPQAHIKPGDFNGMKDQLLPKNNPFGPPSELNPNAKSMAALAALWESNFGPLDETPELKRVLFDLKSADGGLDLDLKDDQGHSLLDLLKNGASNDLSLGDGLGGESNDWKMPEFELPEIGWGKWFRDSPSSSSSSSPSMPSMPRFEGPGSSSGSGWGNFGSFGGLGGSWLPVVLLGVALLAGLGVWWFMVYRNSSATGSLVGGKGLGPWPVNPRNINSREDVVKAFEYLSVLYCGPAAKMWTHSTIAEALNHLAITHEDAAVKLARLYELARYAPLDEPLTRVEVIEARHLVCDLAGVS